MLDNAKKLDCDLLVMAFQVSNSRHMFCCASYDNMLSILQCALHLRTKQIRLLILKHSYCGASASLALRFGVSLSYESACTH